ncbi:MAG: hypothetical protein IJ298_03620 [Ruminococcus sp.]|nr:hypothetical protein [Ruminococcus sp.]
MSKADSNQTSEPVVSAQLTDRIKKLSKNSKPCSELHRNHRDSVLPTGSSEHAIFEFYESHNCG